jgi:hypothetical protein
MRIDWSKKNYIQPLVLARQNADSQALMLARRDANAAHYAYMSYYDPENRPDDEGNYFKYSARELAAYCKMIGDQAIIAFRGTLVSSLENWSIDIDCRFRGKPSRHRGFYDGWNGLRPEITKWLEASDPKSITITGHSLGGAMAVLAAYDLAERWPIAAVTVFGCPRPGTVAFKEAYEARTAGPGALTLAAITTRYVNSTDIVSRVPPPLLFAHVGPAIVIDDNGNRIDPPMPLAVRVVQTALEPQPDDAPPDFVEGQLKSVSRAVAPALVGAKSFSFWGAISFFGVETVFALRRDAKKHDMEKYCQALTTRVCILQRKLEP